MSHRLEVAAREALVRRRTELISELGAQRGREDELCETRESDPLDQGSAAAALRELGGLDDALGLELAAIERALGRLEQGTYGACEVCGEPIDARRLQAIPWSRACVSCVVVQGRGRRSA